MVKYLKVKDVLKKVCRVLIAEPKSSFVSNYEYFKRYGKHIKGLIIKRDGKYSVWQNGQFEPLGIDTWYETTNEKGEKVKKSYLEELFTYDFSFQNEEQITDYTGKTELVTDFKLQLTYAQHRKLQDMIGDIGMQNWLRWDKPDRSFVPIPLTKIEDVVKPEVKPLTPMKKPEFTESELSIIEDARGEGMTQETFKAWLLENKKEGRIDISVEKIEKMASKLVV
jgi:hypothetical protein